MAKAGSWSWLPSYHCQSRAAPKSRAMPSMTSPTFNQPCEEVWQAGGADMQAGGVD